MADTHTTHPRYQVMVGCRDQPEGRSLMRRREFIKIIGGSAAGWPLRAHTQQSDHMRRIGVLMPATADEPEAKARIAVFQSGLRELGWTDGSNVQTVYRWVRR